MEISFKKMRKVFYLLSNKRTWRDIEYFDSSWTKRIREMAKYITPGKSVLDLGCGKMWLRQYLHGGIYYPVDYMNRGEGTIVCDFNKMQFPEQHAQIAFVSGTLEYVSDAKWFLFCIAKSCNECVISYCTLDDNPDPIFRCKQTWVNNYSRDEIIRMFSDVGFLLVAENVSIPRNRIFHFIKTSS